MDGFLVKARSILSMKNRLAFDVVDLGKMSYSDALIEQENRFNDLLAAKRDGTDRPRNTLLLVEHLPVYTLGKSGNPANLKRRPEEVGAEFFRTTRGGDITYHGPGQIVGYPIFDLEQFGMGIAQYIWSIEEAIIDTIKPFGLNGARITEASGVWLDAENEDARKICAIGVKASRYVTMHGFAFNVNTDLSYFDHIIPCGIDDKAVTSIANELRASQDLDEFKERVADAFETYFKTST